MKNVRHWLMAMMTALFVMGQAYGSSKVHQNQLNRLYSEDTHQEEWCLALNIYYEARSDMIAGQYAVADVTLNRVDDPRFPNTVCEVVKQAKTNKNGKIIKWRCAFSWYCDGKSDTPTEITAWEKAQTVAYQIINNGQYRGITEGSTHYHNTKVFPYWAESVTLIGRIGDHIFYRWEK